MSCDCFCHESFGVDNALGAPGVQLGSGIHKSIPVAPLVRWGFHVGPRPDLAVCLAGNPILDPVGNMCTLGWTLALPRFLISH